MPCERLQMNAEELVRADLSGHHPKVIALRTVWASDGIWHNSRRGSDAHRKRRSNPAGAPIFADTVGHPLDLNACYQQEMNDVLKRAGSPGMAGTGSAGVASHGLLFSPPAKRTYRVLSQPDI
jgi:hypothetical protein